MPLMAHKEHGFKNAQSGEVPELLKAGWEPCDDVMEFKRRVWGIGVAPVMEAAPIEEPIAVAEEPATIEPEATERKRPGRPRKADQEPIVQDYEPEQDAGVL